MKKRFPLLLLLNFVYIISYAQLCSGTTRIVWKDDFGSGASIVGPASSNITSTYIEQNYGVIPGNYSLVNYFNYQTCCWYKIPEDHTPNDIGGYFLVVDGGGASKFYSASVTNICPNTTYTFSAWALNMDLPIFQSNTSFIFRITDLSGNTVAQINTPIIPAQPTTPTWVNFGITFNSGTNSALILNVEFNDNGYNDFGFDDFEFGVCGPLLSISNTVNACQTQIDLQSNIVNNYPNPVYQWYKQDASGNWVPFTTGTNSNYTDTVVTNNNWYKVRVADGASACSYIEDSVQIAANPTPINITISGDSDICKGSGAMLTASGADSYVWSTGETSNTLSINPTTNTTYTVIATKAGCSTSPKNVTVSVKSTIATTVDTSICVGSSYFGHYSSNTYIDTYTSANGCDSFRTVHLTVIDPNASPLLITGNTTACNGKNTTLTASGADNYNWSTGETNTTITVNPSSTTTYTLTGYVSNCATSPKSFTISVNSIAHTSINKTICGGTSYLGHSSSGMYVDTLASSGGCDSIETVNLTVKGGAPNLEMANAFTPNRDGVNDCYGIKFPDNISQLTFFIYNRWGQEVFSTTDPHVCWDGSFQGQRCDNGNYVYYVKATNDCGTFETKGNVLLIR